MYTSPYTAVVLEFLGYSTPAEFEVSKNPDDGLFYVEWYIPDPGITNQQILDNEKPWAASVQIENIYREQEIRSANIDTINGNKVGIEMPRSIIDLLEETYLKILVPAARNAIDEIETPEWWGLQQLRNNRNTLLAHLQLWVDDPTKTAQDILDFDVAGWAGWVIDRP